MMRRRELSLLADWHRPQCCPYFCHHKQHRLVWEPCSNTVHQAVSRGCQKLLGTPNTFSGTSPRPHLLLARRAQARSQLAHRIWTQREAAGCPYPAEMPFFFGTQKENSLSQAAGLRQNSLGGSQGKPCRRGSETVQL